MSDAASAQLGRVVQLVAEMSRRDRQGRDLVSLAKVAAQLGVSTEQVAQDIRTLTLVKDDPDHEWLSSVLILQEGDRIALSSRGHFQRPVRLTPDEMAAVQIGLAMQSSRQPLSTELAELLESGAPAAGAWRASEWMGPGPEDVADIAIAAARERRCVELEYAGSGGAVSTRVVEVHSVIESEGRSYLVAWCRRSRARRHFRADRVLAARLLSETFTQRPAMETADSGELFRAPQEARDRVRVRYSPAVARWLVERHPDAERKDDGSVVVTYEVADVHWLVRTVLQYGAEAEVLEPKGYREVLRRSVADRAASPPPSEASHGQPS